MWWMSHAVTEMQSEMPGFQRGTATSDKPDSVLAKIMDTGEFSDLTFVCNREKFKVHKAIVCTQSEPLKAAAQGGFLESHTGTISMDSFHVQTVKHFVQFMYTGDYDSEDPPDDDRCPGSGSVYPNGVPTHTIDPRYVSQWTASGDRSTTTATASAPSPTAAASFLDHIRANSIGDYYKVDGLVALANGRVKRLIERHGGSKDLLSVLPSAVEEALRSTGDKELREILASAIGEHIADLEDQGLLNETQLNALGFETELAVKVLRNCLQGIPASRRENPFGPQRTHVCNKCHRKYAY